MFGLRKRDVDRAPSVRAASHAPPHAGGRAESHAAGHVEPHVGHAAGEPRAGAAHQRVAHEVVLEGERRERGFPSCCDSFLLRWTDGD